MKKLFLFLLFATTFGCTDDDGQPKLIIIGEREKLITAGAANYRCYAVTRDTVNNIVTIYQVSNDTYKPVKIIRK